MENKVNHDPLMTPEEAAAYLKLGEGTVRNMAACGELPRVKIGRSLRFRTSDLNAYIAQRTAVVEKISA